MLPPPPPEAALGEFSKSLLPSPTSKVGEASLILSTGLLLDRH